MFLIEKKCRTESWDVSFQFNRYDSFLCTSYSIFWSFRLNLGSKKIKKGKAVNNSSSDWLTRDTCIFKRTHRDMRKCLFLILLSLFVCYFLFYFSNRNSRILLSLAIFYFNAFSTVVKNNQDIFNGNKQQCIVNHPFFLQKLIH